MDAFRILGVDSDVSEHELAAAYRRQAKRWHPDRSGDGSDLRMAALNAAYASARRALRPEPAHVPASDPPVRRRPAPGMWLPQRLRERLGSELLGALAEGEHVQLLVRAGGRARGPVRLALTDRRLVWLFEDAVSARVDWVRFGLIADVEVCRPLLRRQRRTLRVRTRTGRRLVFGDLDPSAANAIAARMRR